ncbi:MAG: AGE family epimerase/isomerase [Pseudomonadota bacterium]
MTVFDRVEEWTFNIALPFWRDHGLDRENGGFIEQLTFSGENAGVGFKRTRVTARQIYLFSHAATLGWNGATEPITHGLEFLLGRQFISDEKGFARLTDRYGAVIDDTTDLYDHAFVLFSLSWAYRATGDRQISEWMHRTLDIIETRLSHPSGEGFWHDDTKVGWRQQNPHMHLLEASLAAIETTNEERFKKLAEHIGRLFQDRLFQQRDGVLPEFFTDDWTPANDPEAAYTEPGHHFEWAWILTNLKRLTGLALAEEARALVAFAEKFGVDRHTMATFNRIAFDGATIDGGSRTWPNTERIKAAVAMFELDGKDPMPVFEESAGLLLDQYLATDTPGVWVDAFDASGKPQAETVPTSTLYHVFLAFIEMLRTQPALNKKSSSD